MQILYSNFWYSGKLFLGCALLVACCNTIGTSWETKKERLNYRKEYMEEFVWGISLFWLHAPFSVFFCCFLRVLPPSSQVTPLRNDPYKDRYLTMGGILCDDIISKRSKIWKSIIYKQCFFPTRPQCCLAFS